MNTSLSFEPLTPTAFLVRAGRVYADRVAVIDGDVRYTYAQLLDRALRFAGALRALGVEDGARVAVLAPNTHMLLESHYALPFAGAVLVALNPRLTAADLTRIVEHSGASVLVYDHELETAAREIARNAGVTLVRDDEYEALLEGAAPYAPALADERGLISINYTSGTTGAPRGVMYHHRGAYLQALAMALHMQLDCASVFLWTLPMFHCNGWCFTWAVTAAGGTHLCLRKLDPGIVWSHLRDSGVTHFNAAPTVLIMLAWASAAAGRASDHRIRIATGGA
ncbi:MAG TPA: AMP-binding protein, partial [Burkholderiales bacterium]|nr:AMP-binding protein [Burkholderiales bacterium]